MGTSGNKRAGMSRKLVAIYGGTFDPFHLGHKAMVEGILDCLAPDELRVVPCAVPPHRSTPAVTARQRLEMCLLATSEYPGVIVDDCEMARPDKSFTLDTLQYFRQQLGKDTALVFCAGQDAFAAMDSWFGADKIAKLAHIAVLPRSSAEAGGQGAARVPDCLAACPVSAGADLRSLSCGLLSYLEIPLFPVSSTEVREKIESAIRAGIDPDLQDSLPAKVLAYITQHHLYH